MVNKIRMTLVGLVLLLALAACGDDNEDKASGQAKEIPITSEVNDEATDSTEENDEQEKNNEVDKNDTKINLKNDQTIGVTIDEAIKKYNDNAASNGVEQITEEYKWSDYLDTKQTAFLEIHDDIDMWFMNEKGEDHLKAIYIEMTRIEDRETALATIQTLIQSIDPEMTEKKSENVMAELKLDDPTIAGDDSERFYEENGLIYLLMDDPNNSIEFGIANKNDKELQID